MLIQSHRQEALSRAYIHAIAGRCGMSCGSPEFDYGIDMTVLEIEHQDGQYTETGFRIDIQVKSCTTSLVTESSILYDLDVRTYALLRGSPALFPKILVLLVLPENEEDWTIQDEDGLTLRRCAYWISLRGMPKTSNVKTIRVTIPRANIFSTLALRELMNKVRAGEPL